MKPDLIWIRLISAAALGVILFSSLLLLTPELTQRGFNIVAFGRTAYPAGFTPTVIGYLEFVYGVLGAVMIGWMLAVLALIQIPYSRGATWSWWAIVASVLGWFVIDTTFSLVSGYPGNAVPNAVFLVMFAVPLLATFGITRNTASNIGNAP